MVATQRNARRWVIERCEVSAMSQVPDVTSSFTLKANTISTACARACVRADDTYEIPQTFHLLGSPLCRPILTRSLLSCQNTRRRLSPSRPTLSLGRRLALSLPNRALRPILLVRSFPSLRALQPAWHAILLNLGCASATRGR